MNSKTSQLVSKLASYVFLALMLAGILQPARGADILASFVARVEVYTSPTSKAVAYEVPVGDNSFLQAPSEMGAEVVLSGSARVLASLAFDYYANYGELSGVIVRMYDIAPSGTPGAVLYEKTADVVPGGATLRIDFGYDAKNVLPDRFIYTVQFVNAGGTTAGWTAYNDSAFKDGQVNAANTTTIGIGRNFTGEGATGKLKDQKLGLATSVVATYEEFKTTGSVNNSSDAATYVAGTDAAKYFDGYVDLAGNISYGDSAGWYVDLVLTGLDPSKKYTWTGTADRNGGAAYEDRVTNWQLIGADSSVYASSAGALKVSNTSVEFSTGSNAAGYVARWTDIAPGADGKIVIRTSHGVGSALGGIATANSYKGYGGGVFSLVEQPGVTKQVGLITPNKANTVGSSGSAIWQKQGSTWTAVNLSTSAPDIYTSFVAKVEVYTSSSSKAIAYEVPVGANSYLPANAEYGAQVVLAGSSRILASLSLDYYANYAETGGMVVRLYDVDANGTPKSLIYQKAADVVSNGATLKIDFGYDVANVLPDRFVYTVEFTGAGSGRTVGLITPNKANTVGYTGADFWQKVGSTWIPQTLTTKASTNFFTSFVAKVEVYNSSSNKVVAYEVPVGANSYLAANSEIGAQVVLAGTDRVLASLSFEYYANYADLNGAVVRLYEVDATTGQPGAKIYEKVADVVSGGATLTISFGYDAANVLPGKFIYTVEFPTAGNGKTVGLITPNKANSVGATGTSIWQKEGNAWVPQTLSPTAPTNYYTSFVAKFEVYNSSSNKVVAYEVPVGANQYLPVSSEIGTQVTLSGSSRILASLSFEYYANFNQNNGVTVRLYEVGTAGAPGAKIYEKTANVLAGGATLKIDFGYDAANVLPEKFIYTVEFSGAVNGNTVGLITPNVPNSVGFTGSNLWQREGAAWVPVTISETGSGGGSVSTNQLSTFVGSVSVYTPSTNVVVAYQVPQGANKFVQSTEQIGSEIYLNGTDRVLAALSFEYYANYSLTNGLTLRLYDVDANGVPTTSIYEKTADILGGGATLNVNFSYDAANILPNRFVYTLQFAGQNESKVAGLISPNTTPTVGWTSQNTYWQGSGSGWVKESLTTEVVPTLSIRVDFSSIIYITLTGKPNTEYVIRTADNIVDGPWFEFLVKTDASGAASLAPIKPSSVYAFRVYQAVAK